MITLQSGSIKVEILEDCGFTVHQIYYAGKPVLFSPYLPEDYKSNRDLAGIPLLYPFPNRLARWNFELLGKTVYLPESLVLSDGNNLPIHGLLVKSPFWKITELTKYSVQAYLHFTEHYYEFYPFRHDLFYSLRIEKNKVILNFEIRAEEKLPYSLGFHPYFLLREDKSKIRLFLPVKKHILLNEKMLPVGEEEISGFLNSGIPCEVKETGILFTSLTYNFDDGFSDIQVAPEGESEAILFQKEYLCRITFDRNFSYLQIYSPLNSYGERFFCIEPMTNYTNSLLSGTFSVLDAGEVRQHRVILSFEDSA